MNTWKIRQDGEIVDSGECAYYHEKDVLKCHPNDGYRYDCMEWRCPIKEDDFWQYHLKKVADEISDGILKNTKEDEMKYTPEQRKEIREKHGLSLKEVAEKTGIGDGDIYMLEEQSEAALLILGEPLQKRCGIYDAFLAELEQPYEFKTAAGQSAEFTIDKEPEMEETGSIKYAKDAFCTPQSYDVGQVIMHLCDKVFERTKQRDEQKKYANSLQAKIDRAENEEDYGKCEGCGCKLEERHYEDVEGVQFCAHCWIEVLCDPTCTVEEKPEPVISREFLKRHFPKFCDFDYWADEFAEDEVPIKQWIKFFWDGEVGWNTGHVNFLVEHGAIDESIQLTGKSLVIEKPEVKVGDAIFDSFNGGYGTVISVGANEILMSSSNTHIIKKSDINRGNIHINPRKVIMEDGKITVEE